MRRVAACGILLILCACSGGGGGGGPPPPAPSSGTTTVSGLSPFAPGCGGTGGTVYINAEVEPHLAVDPRDANHLVGVWQQDRWSNGSSRGLVTGVSFDGGLTWTFSQAPFSNCTGGNALNGGDYLRATDPWVAFAPDGTVHQISLSTSGGDFATGSANAVLASRSSDGGRTWSNPVTLIRDGASAFNDKETLTADPADARFVYAVWDRITQGAGGTSHFARTTDGGASWEPARAIYDPGPSAQTIANLIRVLPDGTLVNMYAWLRGDAIVTDGRVEVIRSTDRGVTWSQPIRVSSFRPLGARDPVTGQVIRDGSIVPQMAVAPNGALYVVWQDSRFSGARDAIALSRSSDGGLTWSAPVSLNGSLAVPAFTPQVHVRADGVVGVSYFDLRSDTADPATLLVDYWLARSSDGVSWTETRISPAFDIATAPVVNGAFFVGDYMGLASAGDAFLAFYVRTTGNALNRTDVFMTRVSAATAGASEAMPEPRLAIAGDADVERRSLEHLAREKARRLAR
jgi:hypothetical protein